MHEELLKVTNELYTVSDELILLTANLCSEGGPGTWFVRTKCLLSISYLRSLSHPRAITQDNMLARIILLLAGFDGSREEIPSCPAGKSFHVFIRQWIMPSNCAT